MFEKINSPLPPLIRLIRPSTTSPLDDYKGWSEGLMRNAPEGEPGILMANGGQIFASNTMFEEAAGIGLKRSAEDPAEAKTLNGSVSVTSDGLVLNSTAEGKFHKLVIPKVSAQSAVYVRTTPIEGASLMALDDGENGACLLHNKDGEPVDVIDGGFHLFVPDGIRELVGSSAAEGTYTVNGMKMEKMPSSKGVYIINGKKVVIK